MIRSSGEWNDLPCLSNNGDTRTNPFICNPSPVGIRPIVLVKQLMNYNNAKQYCIDTYGSTLASIRSEAENDYVFSISEGKTIYIGMSDLSSEGNWVWEDGYSNPNMYLSWDKDEPNNANNEDCATMRQGFNGDWNDKDCGGSYWFICNADPNTCYGGFPGNPAYGMYIYI